jgi:hypothetical protein
MKQNGVLTISNQTELVYNERHQGVQDEEDFYNLMYSIGRVGDIYCMEDQRWL